MTAVYGWIDVHPAAVLVVATCAALLLTAYAGSILGWWERPKRTVTDDPQQEYTDAADEFEAAVAAFRADLENRSDWKVS